MRFAESEGGCLDERCEECGAGGSAHEDVGPEDEVGVGLIFCVGGLGPVGEHFGVVGWV